VGTLCNASAILCRGCFHSERSGPWGWGLFILYKFWLINIGVPSFIAVIKRSLLGTLLNLDFREYNAEASSIL